MLNSEEQIAKVLNEAGIQATQNALQQFDTDGNPIDVGGEKLTSKGQEKKVLSPLWRSRKILPCVSN
ncbi:MAG: hypothetical protein AAF573_16140 [Bacteroidota bacterium]